MSTLPFVWGVVAALVFTVGLAQWVISRDTGDPDGAAWGARVVLFCWAWPLGVLALVPLLIRDALNRKTNA